MSFLEFLGLIFLAITIGITVAILGNIIENLYDKWKKRHLVVYCCECEHMRYGNCSIYNGDRDNYDFCNHGEEREG